MLPAEWLAGAFASPEKREKCVAVNDLAHLPASLPEFLTFFERRRELLRHRLASVLGVHTVVPAAI